MADPRLDPWYPHRRLKRAVDGGFGYDPAAKVVGSTCRGDLPREMTTDGNGQPLGSAPRGALPAPAARRSAARETTSKPGLRVRAGLPPRVYGDTRAGALIPDWEAADERLAPGEVAGLCQEIMRAHTAVQRTGDSAAAEARGRCLARLRASMNGTYIPLVETSFPFTVSEASEFIEAVAA